MAEKKYEWVDEEERKKLNMLERYLESCIKSGLNAFCYKHSWLVQFPMSQNEGSFYGDLFWLCLRNAQFCFGKKSREDLEPIYKYDEWFIDLQAEASEKIAEEQKLNSDQAKKMESLAYERVDFLYNRLGDRRKIKGALYRDGRDYKAFWMEAELSNFIKIMKEAMQRLIKRELLVYKIPEAFMKGDGAKKYQGDKGRKRFTKDITDEVFAEFEKDLREVQRDVMTYLEASKHWWEKWWVQWVLIAVAGLSGISSLFTIGVWFIPIGTVIVVVWLVVDIVRMRRKNRRL